MASLRSPFPTNVLPTNSDVLKRVMLSKETNEIETGKQNIPKRILFSIVVKELIELWERSSLPHATERTILAPDSRLGSSSTKELSVTMDLNCIPENLFDPQNVCIPQLQYPWGLLTWPSDAL